MPQHHRKYFIKRALISVGVIVLGSCGKAGLDSSTPDDNGKFYIFSGGPGLGLYRVDLNDPEFGTQTLEANGVTWPRLLTSLDLTARGVRVGEEQFVVYVKDRVLWKVDASPGAAAAPQRVSTSVISDVCDVNFLSTGLRALDGQFLWESAGEDGQCVKNAVGDTVDNRRYAIRLGPSEDAGAIDITDKASSIKAVKTLSDPSRVSSGAVEILAKNNASLIRYAMGWGGPVKLADTSTVYGVLLEGAVVQGDGTFVRLDNNLHWYDRPAQKLTPALFTPSDRLMRYDLTCEQGNPHCYVVTALTKSTSPNNGPPYVYSSKVFTIPADGSGASMAYSVESENYAAIPLNRYQMGDTLARDYFFVYMFPNGGSNWYRYPKIGKPPVAPEKVETIIANRGFALGEKIYFNGYLQTRYAAQILNQDGINGKVYNDAQWVAMATLTPQGSKWTPTVMVSKIAGLLDYEGAELSVFDVKNNSAGVVLGVLPEGTIGLHGKHVNDHIVVFGLTFGDTATLENRYDDIFIADTRIPDSLRRLTTTPTVNEVIL